MDLSKLVAKPKIDYTPETVLTKARSGSVGSVNLAGTSEIDTTPPEVMVSDAEYVLKYEIAKLQDLEDAIVRSVSGVPVTVETESGIVSVTSSDYVASLGSKTAGGLVAVEAVERYHSNVLHANSRPEILLLNSIYLTKERVKSSLNMLGGELFANFYSDPVKKTGLDTKAASTAVDLMKADASMSNSLRREILSALRTTKQAITKCLVKNMLSPAGSAGNYDPGGARRLLSALKSMRTMMKFSATAYAADWKSICSHARSTLYDALTRQMLQEAMLIYENGRSKLLSPIEDWVNDSTGMVACPMFDAFADIILQSVASISSKRSNIVQDLWSYKQAETKIGLDSVKSTRSIMMAKKFIPTLDALIAGLEEIISTGEIAKATINRILSSIRSTDSMANASEDIMSELSDQYSEFEMDPDYPDPMALVPPSTGDNMITRPQDMLREYYGFPRSTDTLDARQTAAFSYLQNSLCMGGTDDSAEDYDIENLEGTGEIV